MASAPPSVIWDKNNPALLYSIVVKFAEIRYGESTLNALKPYTNILYPVFPLKKRKYKLMRHPSHNAAHFQVHSSPLLQAIIGAMCVVL